MYVYTRYTQCYETKNELFEIIGKLFNGKDKKWIRKNI